MLELYTVEVNDHTKHFEHEPTQEEIREFVRSIFPDGKQTIEIDGTKVEIDVEPKVLRHYMVYSPPTGASEAHGFVDRFEGHLAVIEVDGSTINVPRNWLPEGAKTGDAVILNGTDIRLDPSRKAKREKEIKDLMDVLWED